ncbi:MAG: MFS transporter [Verrucomicrobiales bacterium]|nr:MFS transporter [Verrucomicrobiales bacterium]MCP5526151.1 MFS transporter [Verrucomicrobiales bacterium]
MRARKPSLLIIFLTVFIDLIGFGIVLPLLPRYGERYGAEGLMIGLIIASFSVMQFLFAPSWGRLSDRIGRRPVLLLSNAGSAVSYALFGWASLPGWSANVALGLILFSRVFAGACGANISVASAYIADVTPTEKRSRGMALIGVAFGLGFILGPALGALSAAWFGLAGPGFVAAVLCAVNFLLACVILVESREPGSARRTAARPGLRQWAHTLAQPKLGLLIWLYLIATFCFACFESTLPLLVGSPAFHPDDLVDPRGIVAALREGGNGEVRALRGALSPDFRTRLEEATPFGGSDSAARRALFREFNRVIRTRPPNAGPAGETPATGGDDHAGEGRRPDARGNRLAIEQAFPGMIRSQSLYFDEKRLGYIFAFCGLMSVLVQGGVGRLVKRMGEARLILASLVLFAVSLALLPYVGTLAGLLVVLALVSAGSGINRAPTMGLISILAPAEEQGSTLGVAQSAATLGRIFGPMFATALYAVWPHSAYLAAAGLALVAAGLAWWGLVRGRRGAAGNAQASGGNPAPGGISA